MAIAPDFAVPHTAFVYCTGCFNHKNTPQVFKTSTLMKSTETSIAEELVLRGNQSALEKHYQEALRSYSAAAESAPGNCVVCNNIGCTNANMGMLTEALHNFNVAIESAKPPCWEPYYNRGNIRAQLGDSGLAISDYTSAVDVDPSSIIPYADRGIVHYERGDFSDASDDFRTFLAKAPPRLLSGLCIQERLEHALGSKRMSSCETKTVKQRSLFYNSYLLLMYAKRYGDATEGFTKVVHYRISASLESKAAYNAACGLAVAGKSSEAMEWLTTAYNLGWKDIDFLKGDPHLESLRGMEHFWSRLSKSP